MEEVTGWIKLSRKLLQSKFYLGEKFTKTMCWVDLLLLAEWRKERTFLIRGIEVVVKRGQIAMALVDLHRRWGLSVNTVRHRLHEMVKDGRIQLETNNVITKITILNWKKYQGADVDFVSGNGIIESDNIEPRSIEEQKPAKEVAEVIEQPIAEIAPNIGENCQMSSVTVAPTTPKKPEVDCDFVLRLFHHHCPSLPKVLKLSDKRKMKIRVRFEEMGYNYEILQQVFDKAEASRFMRGDNTRGWSADFDWIFSNGTNWVKILEGKYDNKEITTSTLITNNGDTRNTATVSSNNGGCYTPTTPSQRQQLSVLTTLAKIEQEYGGTGNITPGTGSSQ